MEWKGLMILVILKDQLKNFNLETLINQMLDHIGSTDSELRDDLIYQTFARLITDNLLSQPLLIHITKVCLDQEHLFYQMEEENTDSVFTRSFSALVLTLILQKDRIERFLPTELALQVCHSAIQYLNQEKDYRGYVEKKGWAHSIAHGADLLDAAVNHPLIDKEIFYPNCLNAITKCILRKDGVYIENEDERLLFSIESMLLNNMDEYLLERCIHEISQQLHEQFQENRYSRSFYYLTTNVINFFHSLYFRLLFKNMGTNSRKLIVNILKECHQMKYPS